jgi:hypothetical protein
LSAGPARNQTSGFGHATGSSAQDADVQRRGDECVPKRVRPDVLNNPGLPGGAADDPGRALPVQPPPVRSQEDRASYTLADGQIDCPGGTRRQR